MERIDAIIASLAMWTTREREVSRACNCVPMTFDLGDMTMTIEMENH